MKVTSVVILHKQGMQVTYKVFWCATSPLCKSQINSECEKQS